MIIIIVHPQTPLFSVDELHERYHPNYGGFTVGSFEKRLKRLENEGVSEAAIIEKLISRGVFFDELSADERAAYERYKESWGGVPDDIAAARLDIMFLDTPEEVAFHFPLTKRKRPPTPEEHAQRVQEIQELFDRIAREEKQDEE